MKVKSYIKRGNSFPIILEDKGQNYFVKLRAGMSGKYSLINEWIGNKLGNQLNIKTQIPNWMELESDVHIENIHIEVRELISKSFGLNIGFKYQKEAIEIKGQEWQILAKRVANEIFLFDLMMINIDRTVNNTNLMRVKEEVISIDYESSLLFQDAIGNNDLLKNQRILECLKNNPLYDEIAETAIEEFISKTERISVHQAIAEIPLSILGTEERSLFLSGIEQRKRNNWFLMETMEKLKNIKTETEAEHKHRVNRNQAAFRRKFKENIKN